MKYRKKSLVVEALRFDGSVSSAAKICKWANEYSTMPDGDPWIDYVTIDGVTAEDFLVHSLEGIMEVAQGDWVIKGIKGEFYPCKQDIFGATYEAVG